MTICITIVEFVQADRGVLVKQ